MALSSNSVIHFTKNLSSLIGILTDSFKIKYCRETIIAKDLEMDLLIPMVSFCDIPFSQVLNHIQNYGEYGIGLKKKWAEDKGLNPVFYLEKKSNLSLNIIKHLFNKIKTDKLSIKDLDIQDKYHFDFLRYIKNYQADLVRKNKKTIPEYRFSDEREWRFVLDTINNELPFARVPKNNDVGRIQRAKDHLNHKISQERLIFTPEDINYIIIKKESERDNIITSLEKIKGKFPHEQVKRLTSRIISGEQLKTDF